MIKGIQYVTDMVGKPVAVQIDLKKYGELWQDFSDVIISENRKKEPHSSWKDVKKRLAKKEK